jgi:type IX secretion system PorP/SprF family membrane protein
MKHRIYLFIFYSFFLLPLYGQDPHLSQYFSSPLTINPALTANMEPSFRVSLVHRQQWWQSNFPFTTSVLGGELRLLSNQLQEGNRLGIGLVLENDISLGGAYKTNKASFSAAYHQSIDENRYQTLGLGIQLSTSNKIINFNSLGFENQFNGSQIDLTLNSGESFLSNSRNYLDVNAGIVYSFDDGEKSFYLGGAIQNILQPNISFFADSSSRINMRKIINGGANFYPNSNSSSRLLLSFLLMEQSKSTEMNLGAALGLETKAGYVYFGLFSRFGDAIYPYVSFQSNSIQVGFSYDFTTSQLKNSRKSISSGELSVSYVLRNRAQEKRNMPWNF